VSSTRPKGSSIDSSLRESRSRRRRTRTVTNEWARERTTSRRCSRRAASASWLSLHQSPTSDDSCEPSSGDTRRARRLEDTPRRPSIDHLLRLIASWSLLADLAFSDMLLMAKVDEFNRDDESFVVLGQMRPNNRTTLINDDLVGTTHECRLAASARSLRRRPSRRGEADIEHVENHVPVWCVPVRCNGAVVAVLVRLQGPCGARPRSSSSPTFRSSNDSVHGLGRDVSLSRRRGRWAGIARVGDGVILINALGEVEFATPNAVNALHRLGSYTSAEGRTLDELGVHARVIERSLEFAIPALEEIDRGHDVAILFHGVPLIEDQKGHRCPHARARRVGPTTAQPHGAQQRGGRARSSPRVKNNLQRSRRFFAFRRAGVKSPRRGPRCTRPSAEFVPSPSYTKCSRASP